MEYLCLFCQHFCWVTLLTILWSVDIDRWSPAAENKWSCFDLHILMLGWVWKCQEHVDNVLLLLFRVIKYPIRHCSHTPGYQSISFCTRIITMLEWSTVVSLTLVLKGLLAPVKAWYVFRYLIQNELQKSNLLRQDKANTFHIKRYFEHLTCTFKCSNQS